jgi:hypothetical protein
MSSFSLAVLFITELKNVHTANMTSKQQEMNKTAKEKEDIKAQK